MLRRLGLLLILGFCATTDLSAQTPGSRQYYSGWTKHSSKPYYYRTYYYKTTVTATTYSYHYGIYYPSRGHRVYMYNPHTKRYWGYWDGESYALLTKEKQKTSLDDIAAEDFPKPGKAPTIPEVEDGTTMLAPPMDFPKLENDKP